MAGVFRNVRCCGHTWSRVISHDSDFTECVVLRPDAFDPDAVFLDDIVDDNVLPNPTLAVDGLTEARDAQQGLLDIDTEQAAANEALNATGEMPDAAYDPEQLEVYGWESSIWQRVKGYIGF